MFKIDICGTIHEIDEMEVRKQRLFIDGIDQGIIGFTLVTKVIEGDYSFIKNDGNIRWTSK